MTRPVGRPVEYPCGTHQAYKRNARRKLRGQSNCGPCDACHEDWARVQREYYAKRKGLTPQ